tara:strand:+ start:148 stop:1794 length:1647 start_codon:yes stop_codon:yes gene_type:complete
MSRLEQATGDSLRRQIARASEYADKHGLTLTEDYRDIGVSAYKGLNKTEGTLASFLKAIHAGEVPQGSVLIVESLDRLSRQEVTSALELFLSILRSGVEIATLSDGQRYTHDSVNENATQILVSIFVMIRAHEESSMKSQRVGMAWAQKRIRAATGIPMTSLCPLWLKRSDDGSGWVEIPDRVEIVRRIFRDSLYGLGAYKIAQRLTEEGVAPWRPRRSTPTNRKVGWQPSTIKKILSNESVLGRFQPHTKRDGQRIPAGNPIENYFPTIVSEAEFWNARSGAIARQTNGAGQKGHSYSNLLSGVVFCGECGGPAHFINKGQRKTYFQCDGARRKVGCENRKLYQADVVELGAFSNLSKISFDDVFAREAIEAESLKNREEKLRAEIASLNSKQARLLVLVENEEETIVDALSERIVSLRTMIREQSLALKKISKMTEVISANQNNKETTLEIFERAESMLNDINLIPEEADRYRERSRISDRIKRYVRRIELYKNFAIYFLPNGVEELVIFDTAGFQDIESDLRGGTKEYVRRWQDEAERDLAEQEN